MDGFLFKTGFQNQKERGPAGAGPEAAAAAGAGSVAVAAAGAGSVAVAG
jgi:hypothetical protein